ncbi:hypothetical protein CTheo_461 [Ceratobasidium theobromae]|uniref:Uncharacterized protein n=1 Tax=Ceratobasidium theobromae TaxID=1582974 RepID=A0A5N5QX48_9AGAM|nr:hypothetical protein CTheo_461 [Ceratobasidium theobromae]
MASPSHEDHSDLDSLFGDDEEERVIQESQQRSIIRFPRAAVLSQNVGTIAHSSVPSSTEHSSGPMSSPSISPTRDIVPEEATSIFQGKRNAAPTPHQPNKKRRVEFDSACPSSKVKPTLVHLLHTASGQPLSSAKLKSIASLLAPSTSASRHSLRGLKGKPNTAPGGTAPIPLGIGTATDPVVISDEPSATPPSSLSDPSLSSGRRLTRSQQARLLLEALPNDPSDVLSQTLSTILKNPTVPHGRSNAPRDTAVYLANGRLTGTPFLRLLRYLAGPSRRTDPALGLALLKKLVEAMRATEEMTSKAASVNQSSAASTPTPTTPGTPSATSFPFHDYSMALCSSGHTEPTLFSQFDLVLATGLGGFLLPPIPEFDAVGPSDIVIDPELLALSQDPAYLQISSQSFHDFEFDFSELLGALPAPLPDCAGSTEVATDPGSLAIDPSTAWGNPTDTVALDNFLSTWSPDEQSHPPVESQLATITPQHIEPAPSIVASMLDRPGVSAYGQGLKHQSHSPSSMRIPPRVEALALLERAQARKKELEAKISLAKRQLWGCKIEAGAEQNLLDRLKKGR